MQIRISNRSGRAAFTIAEMVVCFAIMGLVIGGILTAYTNSAKFTERAGYNLAAQAQAIQVLERVRAALWDTQTVPITDWTSNLPTCTTNVLDLPVSGNNVIWATNYLSISNIVVNAGLNVQIKMISVTTMWPWNGGVQSNTVVAYRAPDA